MSIGLENITEAHSVEHASSTPMAYLVKKAAKGWDQYDKVVKAPEESSISVPPPYSTSDHIETQNLSQIPENAELSILRDEDTGDDIIFNGTWTLCKLVFQLNREQKMLYVVISHTLLDESTRFMNQAANDMKSWLGTVLQIGSGVFVTVAGMSQVPSADWLKNNMGWLSKLGADISGDGAQLVKGVSGTFQGVGTLAGEGAKIRGSHGDSNSLRHRTKGDELKARKDENQASIKEVTDSRDQIIATSRAMQQRRSEATRAIISGAS